MLAPRTLWALPIDVQHGRMCALNATSSPTGFVLQGGDAMLGFWESGYGVTDHVQVGTRILDDVIGDANVSVRAGNLSLADTSVYVSAGVAWLYHQKDSPEGGSGITNQYLIFTVGATVVIRTGWMWHTSLDAMASRPEVGPTAVGGGSCSGVDWAINEHNALMLQLNYERLNTRDARHVLFDDYPNARPWNAGATLAYTGMWENFYVELGIAYIHAKWITLPEAPLTSLRPDRFQRHFNVWWIFHP